MRAEHTRRFQRSLRGRSDAEFQAAGAAMLHAAESFGRPHAHAGIDIRRLGRNLFECRAGLDLRLVFRRDGDALVFDFAGDHDAVQSYLRNR